MIPKNLSRTYLSLAFINGIVVMALEISASRILAPYFGTSIFVWTNIIGVVLASLAVGYFLGGKLSENKPSIGKLLNFMLVNGLLVILIPWLIHPLARSLTSLNLFANSGTIFITIGSLLSIMALFGLPLLLLGITSPYLIKLSSQNTEHVGEISGKLFSVSTLGSLFGTFLPTLVFIPQMGTRATILSCGFLLITIGSVGLPKWKFKLPAYIMAILAGAATFTQSTLPANVIYSAESPYQDIRITEVPDGTRYLQFDAGFGMQSVYHPNSFLTGYYYYDYFATLPAFFSPEKTKNILIIGLAGGTIARQIHHYYRTSVNITGVEIDPTVTKASKQYLGLSNVPIKIISQDGRIFLSRDSNTYDIIVIDAYQNEFQIPWTLTTKEFWENAKARLNPNGMVSMNIATSTKHTELLDAFVRTGKKVFPHAYITDTGGEKSIISNFLLTFTGEKLPFEMLNNNLLNTELELLADNVTTKTFEAETKENALLLTDDKAPVDLLTAQTLWKDVRKATR